MANITPISKGQFDWHLPINENFNNLNTQKAELAQLQNRNLLDNWDFRNAVNQRGISAFSVGAMGLDRWKLDTGSCTVNLRSIVLNGRLRQNVEIPSTSQLFTGSNITLSVLLSSGETKSVTGTMSSEVSGVVDGITLTFAYGTTWTYFQIETTVDSEILAVKAEIGGVETLLLDPPMNYAAELLTCMRYLYNVKGNGYIRIRATLVSSGYIDVMVPTPVSLRATPTVAREGTMNIINMSGANQTGFAAVVNAISANCIAMRFNKASHGLSDAGLNIYDTIFSAEI